MVTEREGREGDEPRILELVDMFLELTPYGKWFPPAPGHIERMLRMTVEHGMVFVSVDASDRVVGMIGGVLVPHLMLGHIYAEETCWFVDPSARSSGTGERLLHLLEGWAGKSGAIMLKMAAPANSPVGKLLERRGYAQVETAFIKTLRAPSGPVSVQGVDADDLQRAARRGQRRGEEPTEHAHASADAAEPDGAADDERRG